MNAENNFQTPLKQDLMLGFDYGGGKEKLEEYLKPQLDNLKQLPININGTLYHHNIEGNLVKTTEENKSDKFEKLASDKPSGFIAKWENYKKWHDFKFSLGLWYLRIKDYNYLDILLFLVAGGIGFTIGVIIWA